MSAVQANVEDLFGALEQVALEDTSQVDAELEEFRRNLRAYHEAQELEKKAKDTKNELKSACLAFMKKHKQTNYDYAELGVKAVCFERTLQQLNEHRLDEELAFHGLSRIDVSTFADWEGIWNSLPTVARRQIIALLQSFGVQLEEQMLVSEELVKMLIGPEKTKEIFYVVRTGFYDFRLTPLKRKA